MKKMVVALVGILGFVGVVYACTTQTVMTPNGAQTCTTCCVGNNCNTTCF